VLVFEAPLVDSNGRHTGWMSSILDITDRKRAEELARQQQEKLETSARLATMGEISSMLAHELNQPLAAISSYTAGALNVLARAGRGDGDAGMLKRALEQANTQARRAGQIIRSVHEFVKKREPRREIVTVQHVIDGIRALVDLQARQSYVTLQVECPPDLPPVLADRVLLEQVLLNLTRNAIEAMQDIDRERRVLRIAAAHERGRTGLGVRDRQWPRHPARGGRAPVLALLLDQGRGHGHGPVDLPHRDRIPRRHPHPRRQSGRRHRVHVHAAAGTR
jgi:two-component system sensor histidine kinase DctS